MAGSLQYTGAADERHRHTWATPASSASLYEWARADIPADPFLLSRYCSNLVVWLERETLEGAPAVDTARQERDLRRLEVRLEAYAQREREALDDEHRLLVWVARCKLAHLAHNTVGLEREACQRYEGDAVARASWEEGDDAAWLRAHGLAQRAPLAQTTTLQLWKWIAVLLDRWQQLPYCAELCRLVREMRWRVAVFLSSREPAPLEGPAASEHGGGLLWRVVLDARGTTQTRGQGAALLTQPLFRRTSVDGRYVSVNEDFLVETERVFFHMERDLRRCAGLQWAATTPTHSAAGCAACAAVGGWQADEALPVLHAMVAAKTQGAHAQFIEEEFRERVFQYYVQPGELERFAKYNKFDEQKADVCLSKLRETAHEALAKRLTSDPPLHVWERMVGEERRDPAYVLMSVLGLDYEFQAQLEGVSLAESGYLSAADAIDVWSPCTPANRHRVLADLFYRTGHTTGTLAYQARWKLLHGQRQDSPAAVLAMNYQHPLVVKMLHSYCVLHRGVLHPCSGGFAHALCAWVRCFCEDDQLLGRLQNGASMTGLYERLHPSRADRARAIAREAQEQDEGLRPVFFAGGVRPENPPALETGGDDGGYC